MNVVGVFVSPIGITTHLYRPYLIKESSLWNIFISNTALLVSTVKINRYEVLHTSHLVQQILVYMTMGTNPLIVSLLSV